MRTTVEFLDAVRERHHLSSDYQLSKHLGITRQRISQFRSGRETLGEETALKVAAALGIEPAHVLACVAAERTKSPTVRKAWEKAAAATAAAVLIALALPYGAAPAGEATLYIMLSQQARFPILELACLFTLFLICIKHPRCP